MKIIVDHNELNNVANVLNKNATNLDQELDKMVRSMETLGTIWQGKDAEIFRSKVNRYLTHMRSIPEAYRNFEAIIKQTDNNYKLFDRKYAESIKKAVVEIG